MLAYNSAQGSIFYYKYDGGSWDSGEYVSAATSDQMKYSRADFEIDSSGKIHLAMKSGSTWSDSNSLIYYAYRSAGAGGSWTYPLSTISGGNNGVDLALDSNETPHFIWFEHNSSNTYRRVVYQYYDGALSTPVYLSQGSFSSASSHTGNSLSLTMDISDDPYIYVQTGSSWNTAKIHYQGTFPDPSLDEDLYPADSDSDGVANNYQLTVTPKVDGDISVKVLAGEFTDTSSISNPKYLFIIKKICPPSDCHYFIRSS